MQRARLDEARRKFLSGGPRTRVAEVAAECGFSHLGRFSALYRDRYGEVPSGTLRRAALDLTVGPIVPQSLLTKRERVRVAVVPFHLIGREVQCMAGIEQELVAQLCRLNWVTVTSTQRARYHLHGKIQSAAHDRLRATVLLLDSARDRYLLADTSEGSLEDMLAFQERVSRRITSKLWSPIIEAEGSDAVMRDPLLLDAWSLTMLALRGVLSVEPKLSGATLEYAERAMELAPDDALPVSVAAWCHSVRASHHQTREPIREREAARRLAHRAAELNGRDATTEAMLTAAYTLAHDMDVATAHAARALQLDSGSAWAWGRSAWVQVYRGNSVEAIERFQVALALAPSDPLKYQWSLGIASAHFEAGHYDKTMEWGQRALAEQPKAVTVHRLLAPACALAGDPDRTKHSILALQRQFPDLTISQIVGALPLTHSHLARRAEGLEQAGLRW